VLRDEKGTTVLC